MRDHRGDVLQRIAVFDGKLWNRVTMSLPEMLANNCFAVCWVGCKYLKLPTKLIAKINRDFEARTPRMIFIQLESCLEQVLNNTTVKMPGARLTKNRFPDKWFRWRSFVVNWWGRKSARGLDQFNRFQRPLEASSVFIDNVSSHTKETNTRNARR